MRLRVKPLPTRQRVTACLIWGGTRRNMVRMSWVRTCSWAGQILLRARWLAVGLAVTRRRKRLAVGTVHWRGLADTAPDGMSGNKGLRLGRNGGEDAVLVEPHAVGAAAVLCCLEARASNL